MNRRHSRLAMVAAALVVVALLVPPCQAADDGASPMLVAAAASLRQAFDNDLIPMFLAQNPGLSIEATYDSSGKLQAQIENGLEADVFISAAPKQMRALLDKGFINADSVIDLLENKVVLIRPAAVEVAAVTGFEDADKAASIAVGDPDSVPAGQYAREIFTSLGNWDKILAKASLGTNVTEVLSWVAMASADVGIVYATDAAATGQVKVIAEAPAGSLKNKVVYPAATLKNGNRAEAAAAFVAFLASPEAQAAFEKYGFSPAQKP